MYAELQQAGKPKASPILFGRPVLRPWARMPAGPIRGMYTINGRAFAVGGTSWAEIFPNKAIVVRGTVAASADPVTWACNGTAGNQVLSISGGLGYVFDLEFNDLFQITDPGFPQNVQSCEYLNSVGIVHVKNTNTFFYSEENDFESWNTLDYFETSLTADNKNAMLANHGQLLLAGEQRSEFWGASGNQNTPFEPIQATVVEQGSASPFSLQRLDNAVFLVQGDERGNRMVMRTNGYEFVRVSTNALEFYLNQQSQSQIKSIIGWTCQIEGHAFYGLYLPNAPFTPVYDASTGMWFDWAHWDSVNLVWRQFRVRNHILFGGVHLCGSPASGTIYELTQDYESDAEIAP